MTRTLSQAVFRNRLLKAMSPPDFDLIAANLQPINLPFGAIIELPGEPIDFVVFPETGIASRLVVGRNDEVTESGHVGNEGMTGKPVLLGGAKATNRIVMQVAGNGHSLRAERLVEVMDESREFRLLLTRYAMTCELQSEYTLLAATNHTINQRLARWLLMYHDRIDGDEFQVTHELLAMMLNVRRAGVTSAIHKLEGERAIRSTRGVIHITDREILEEQAAGSYGIPEAFYEDIIPTISANAVVESATAII